MGSQGNVEVRLSPSDLILAKKTTSDRDPGSNIGECSQSIGCNINKLLNSFAT